MVSHETSHSLQLFSEKFIETSKPDGLLEKLPVFTKSMLCRGFSRNGPLFATFFFEKLIQISKCDSLLETLPVFAKSMIFHGFSRNEPLFEIFFRKVHRNLER